VSSAILLIGNYRPSIPLAKMLQSRGYTVIAGALGPEPWFSTSRYISEVWDQNYDTEQPEQLKDELVGYCKQRPDIQAIIPVQEDYVRIFSEHPEWSENLPPLIMLDHNLVQQCLDKMTMMHLAAESAIPIADFAEAKSQLDFEQQADVIGLPIVIRPAMSQTLIKGEKALTISSTEELKALKIDWSQQCKGIILQAKFKGIRHNIYFAAKDGKIYRYMHAVITRTNRTDGSGLAVEGHTIVPDEDIRRYSEKLIESLNYSGIGCVQFLVDEKTRKCCFLELNPRIAGNAILPEYAGLNLFEFQLDLVLKGEANLTQITGPKDIHYVWTSEDIIAAKRAWSSKTISTPQLLRWLGRTVVAALRSKLHIIFSWTDPKPGIIALTRAIPGVNRVVRTTAKPT
jgi:predicted ATP-grasp superfamily ATP-dependent carboligase